jgi:hypothetical protein
MRLLANRRGATLPLSILLLMVLTVGLAAGLAIVTNERKVHGDHEAQMEATALARTGLERYLAQVTSAPPDSSRDSLALIGGYALIATRRATHIQGLENYLVAATGVSTTAGHFDPDAPPARRTLAQYVSWRAPWTSYATVTALAGIDADDHGDHIGVSGTAGSGYPTRTSAVAVPNGMFTGDSAITVAGGYNPRIMYLGSQADAVGAIGIDWAGVLAGTVLTPDTTYPANSSGTMGTAYRLPTTGNRIMYASGNYTYHQPGSGTVQGLLIVENDLVVDTTFRFDGVILVGGTIIDTTTSTALIFNGAIVTGLNLKLPGGTLPGYPAPALLHLTNNYHHNRTFDWNAGIVRNALSPFGPPRLRPLPGSRFDNIPDY